MPKGKGQFATWYCPECNRGNYTMQYIKRRNEEIVKVLNKHCGQCRDTLPHKRKDIKKAAK